MDLTADDVAAATSGEVVSGSGHARATSVTIDSRDLQAGALFVALQAARDGHDYVAHAFSGGATIALVDRAMVAPDTGSAVVRVGDTLGALRALSRDARREMRDVVVVGITGSAGKTATKDLTRAALTRSRRVHASPGSYNNEAGVPLTLLGAPVDAEVVVTEMGARAVGDIADLAALAEPQIGVITHIGLAHAGHLGGRSGIARVKGELLDALPPTGVAVLNDECDETPGFARRTAARVVRVGRQVTSDLRASSVVLDAELRPRFVLETPAGTADVALELRGEHQVENAAQAAAVALEMGVPLDEIVAGLADARPASQRMELHLTPDGVLVLNDAYNSSPTSAAAALHSLASLEVAGRRIAVLGEMLELGEESPAAHEAIGALVGKLGIDLLVAVGAPAEHLAAGARSGGVEVVTVRDTEEAGAVVAAEARPRDAVLVKASRAIGLERVAEVLTRREGAS